MRRLFSVIAVATVLLASCSSSTPEPQETGAPATEAPEPTAQTAAECLAADPSVLYADGSLTIATGNPAYKPWYGGAATPQGAEWEVFDYTGDPYSGEGYESAFAYALAAQLGLSADQVAWIGIRFGQSFAPGDKEFDFAMQQVSITAKRAQAVDFSVGYFDVNQALIANEGSPAIGVTTLEGLKDLRLGAPVGTTSLQVIEELVQPNVEPGAYDDLDLALQDLENGQLDAVVVDYPTAFYGYADVVVGQFPALGGEQEQFGLTFQLGNPLRTCVDLAIEELRAAGTLDALKSQWLVTDTSVPTFS
ncbi:MAG: ABC transporter substrate-binding protein [Actinomycetota bacterium]